jgi:threonine dehydrogenase-like Zn-dependent dehydrogenase
VDETVIPSLVEGFPRPSRTRKRGKIAAMRASSYGGAGRFSTIDVPMPKPRAGDALLRVLRVGICGTDLHIFQGHLDHRVPKGGVIGHETFAEVMEAPPGSGFRPGDRVVVDPWSRATRVARVASARTTSARV